MIHNAINLGWAVAAMYTVAALITHTKSIFTRGAAEVWEDRAPRARLRPGAELERSGR